MLIKDMDAISPFEANEGEAPGFEVTGNHAFELWFWPELRRRVDNGTLQLPFKLARAQVLFSDGLEPQVRFNGEVHGAMEFKAARPVKAGQPVSVADIAEPVGFELELADADCGHFTLIEYGRNWAVFFDFRRNKIKAADIVSRAEQFVAVAELSIEGGYAAPYVDCLFSATELLASARLMMIPEKKLESHGSIHSTINHWRKLGNVDARFVELFNELSHIRKAARYGGSAKEIRSDAPFERIRAEIADLRASMKRFSDIPSNSP
ncbi:hypothetical protein [Bradyrhizobium sp. JR3.5]